MLPNSQAVERRVPTGLTTSPSHQQSSITDLHFRLQNKNLLPPCLEISPRFRQASAKKCKHYPRVPCYEWELAADLRSKLQTNPRHNWTYQGNGWGEKIKTIEKQNARLQTLQEKEGYEKVIFS